MSVTIRPTRLRTADIDCHFDEALHPVLQRVFAARGLSSDDDLDLSLKRLLPVGQLAQIDEAVQLLVRDKGQKIIVVGDFDADGATSTALMLRCLAAYGFVDVSYLVPNRFEFGYGLTPEIVEVAAKSKPQLIVTVDNGISSVNGVKRAAEFDIDVLITDHHLPGKKIPDAAAIVNPNQPGDNFQSKYLAGVGVAFALMAALGRYLQNNGQAGMAAVAAEFLDLVALGTIADVVPLDRNNRILVSEGLRRIRAGRCVPGIRALLAVARREPQRVSAADLGFAVGPRLNAAGRLEDMSIGIETLLCDSIAEARGLAGELDTINLQRREIEGQMQREALQLLGEWKEPDAEGLPNCLALFDARWHEGVVGLLAARIRERIHRPVIAFATAGNGELKGSARSVKGVHIRDLLAAMDATMPGLITRFGGHAMAAGLSMPSENLQDFCELLERVSVEFTAGADFSGTLSIDGALGVDDINLDFAQTLRAAGPWGQAFPEPLFENEFGLISERVVGEKHLKLTVQALNDGPVIDAIAFGYAELSGLPASARLRLVYRLDVNEFRGLRTAQLIVEQITIV